MKKSEIKVKQPKKIIFFILIFSAIILSLVLIYPNIDKYIYYTSNNLQNSSATYVVKLLTELGNTTAIFILTLIIIVFLSHRKNYRALSFYLSVIIAGLIINPLLKEIFARLRPPGTGALGFAFPSGHATTAAIAFWALFIILLPKYRKTAFIFLFIPIIVGLTRIYLKAHWFSDIAGSFLISAIILLTAHHLFYENALSKIRNIKSP